MSWMRNILWTFWPCWHFPPHRTIQNITILTLCRRWLWTHWIRYNHCIFTTTRHLMNALNLKRMWQPRWNNQNFMGNLHNQKCQSIECKKIHLHHAREYQCRMILNTVKNPNNSIAVDTADHCKCEFVPPASFQANKGKVIPLCPYLHAHN